MFFIPIFDLLYIISSFWYEDFELLLSIESPGFIYQFSRFFTRFRAFILIGSNFFILIVFLLGCGGSPLIYTAVVPLVVFVPTALLIYISIILYAFLTLFILRLLNIVYCISNVLIDCPVRLELLVKV